VFPHASALRVLLTLVDTLQSERGPENHPELVVRYLSPVRRVQRLACVSSGLSTVAFAFVGFPDTNYLSGCPCGPQTKERSGVALVKLIPGPRRVVPSTGPVGEDLFRASLPSHLSDDQVTYHPCLCPILATDWNLVGGVESVAVVNDASAVRGASEFEREPNCRSHPSLIVDSVSRPRA